MLKDKNIKIVITAAAIIAIAALGAGGYFLYKSNRDKKQTTDETQAAAPKREVKTETKTLPSGNGSAPKTESPVPDGLSGPSPLPQ